MVKKKQSKVHEVRIVQVNAVKTLDLGDNSWTPCPGEKENIIVKIFLVEINRVQ